MKTKKQNDGNPLIESVDNKNTKNPKYWNGKTSDHPIIQEMIRLDNKVYQIEPNKFGERKGN